jgi:UDP-4-amino-4,6-dideoxy-N-acetyl-beta-L-altrosamine N-acetyltransferase
MTLNLQKSDFSLRPIALEDAELMHSWRNRPEVRNGMFPSKEISLEVHIAWLKATLAAPSKLYSFFCYREKPFGVVGFYAMDHEHSRGEWAFYMGGERDALPKGAGVAMEYLAVDAYFARGLNRLSCQVLESNERVVRIHERFGFQHEGRLRQHVLKPDGRKDVICLSMLSTEWEALRAVRRSEIFAN